MNEKINIQFSGEEFNEIVKYTDILGVDNVQSAIMNAIRIVLEQEKKG